jgi:hypothetical protein
MPGVRAGNFTREPKGGCACAPPTGHGSAAVGHTEK